MNIASFLILSVLFTFLEIFLRSRGLLIPLLPCYVFYLSGLYGKGKGFLCALLFGLIADLLTGRVLPLSILTFTLVAILSRGMFRHPSRDPLSTHIICGLLIPVIVYLPPALMSREAFRFLLIFLLPSCVVTAFLLPLLLILLDTLAEKLALPLYADARTEGK